MESLRLRCGRLGPNGKERSGPVSRACPVSGLACVPFLAAGPIANVGDWPVVGRGARRMSGIDLRRAAGPRTAPATAHRHAARRGILIRTLVMALNFDTLNLNPTLLGVVSL